MKHPIYIKGDIVFFRNVLLPFKDNKKIIDCRLRGHPFLILNDVYELEEQILCLLLRSKPFKPPCKRYEIHKKIGNHHISFVDLDIFYLIKAKGVNIPIYTLSENEVNKIFKKHKKVLMHLNKTA